MRILSDGKVGIGLTAPPCALTVVGGWVNNATTAVHLGTNSGSSQVGISSADNAESIVNFGDTTDYNVGNITYNHSSNYMKFETDNAERMRINSSGNVGIGVVPESDIFTNFKTIQNGVGTVLSGYSGVSETELLTNARPTANDFNTGFKYINTDEASRYRQYNGTHIFDVAASGSADAAITWTTPLTLTNDGRGVSQFTAKNWINYDGAGNSIRDSHNISSVTDRGTGQYTVNFDVDMANAQYCALTGQTAYNIGDGDNRWTQRVTDVATGSARIVMTQIGVNGFSYVDASHIFLAVFGD
jgi:hypothetical protein